MKYICLQMMVLKLKLASMIISTQFITIWKKSNKLCMMSLRPIEEMKISIYKILDQKKEGLLEKLQMTDSKKVISAMSKSTRLNNLRFLLKVLNLLKILSLLMTLRVLNNSKKLHYRRMLNRKMKMRN